jgi:tRNA threonylcarbamoyladenosine biosynthesis protein TsaB
MQGSTAVVSAQGDLIAEETLGEDTRHGKGLMVAVEACVERLPGGIEAVSGILVDVGPGSFTGLRVGVMTAKALAWARRLPVLGVFSLEAMAWERRCLAPQIAICNSARRDEVYLAIFKAGEDSLHREGAIQALSPEEALEQLGQLPDGAAVVGSGLSQMDQAALTSLAPRVTCTPLQAAVPSAAAVAQWGARLMEVHPQGHDLHALQPIYPRREGVSMPVLGEPVEARP